MIKSLINKSVKAALKELFVDGGNFHLSMGADLFSESTIHLKDLVFRPDIFDVCCQPLRLISGHLGKLSVEGIAELALGGGTVRCQAENIFLLFNVDTTASAEQVLFMKKLLLELQGGTVSQVIIRELLTRILGIPGTKTADAIKKRKLLLKGLNYIFKSLIFTVKNVHIRIEIPGKSQVSSGGKGFSAVGITLPQLKFAPHGSKSRTGGKEEPSLSLSIKSLQVYCDYDCESYVVGGDKSAASVLRQFLDRWKSELHTAFLLPFDIEVLFSAEVRSRSGLITPRFAITVPKLRTACDPRQLEVLKELVELMVLSSKRMQQLVKISEVYSSSRLPVIVQSGGTHLLPYMAYGNSQYPQQMGLPRSESHSVVRLMKQLHKQNWAKATWRYAVNLVIDDIRTTTPVHRWIELAKLSRIRKEYAFLYSRLLKRSKETGNFVYNVHAKLDQAAMSKLYAYEMMLPIAVIQCFRTQAVMVAMVDRFNNVRLKGQQNGQPITDNHISLRWRDLIKIYSDIIEARRQTVFNKNAHAGVDDMDDTASVYSDDRSMRDRDSPRDQSSLRSSTPVNIPHTPVPTLGPVHVPKPPAAPASASSTAASSGSNKNSSGMFSSLFGSSSSSAAADGKPTPKTSGKSGSTEHSQNQVATTQHSAGGALMNANPLMAANMMKNAATATIDKMAKAVASAPNQAVKMMLGGMSDITGIQFDEMDTRLIGRAELAAFSEIFGKSEPEERASDESVGGESVHGQLMQGMPTDTSLLHVDVLAKNARGDSPSFAAIRDAVQWAMTRHRRALIMKVPDFSLVVEAVDMSLRLPLEGGSRKNVLHAKLQKVDLNLVISHMGSSSTEGQGIVQMSNGFASLDGSLIQMRVSVDEYAVAVSVNTDASLAHSEPHTLACDSTKSDSQPIIGIARDDGTFHTGPTPAPSTDETPLVPTLSPSDDLGMDSLQNFDIFAPYEGPVIHEDDGLDVYRPYDGTVDSSISAATPSTNIRDKSVGSARNTTYSESTIRAKTEAKIKAIPAGGTVLTAERLRQQQEIDSPKPVRTQPQQQQQQQQQHRGSFERKVDLKSVDLKTMTSKPRKSAFADDPTAVEVFYSEKSSQSIIFCVILDVNANKDEGAADFQVALGNMHIAAGDFALSYLFDPITLTCCKKSFDAIVDMEKLTFSSFTSSLVIDRDLRLPAVLRLHNEEKKSSSSLLGAVPGTIAGPSSGSGKPTHKAIVDYLNLIQWRSIIEKYVPRVFSFCLRTSEVGTDTLTIGSLKELIMMKIRDISDRASPRYYAQARHSYGVGLESSASFNVLMMVLEDIRRQGSIDDVATNNSVLHTRALFPSVEFALSKSVKPFSCIEISAAGAKLLLPLSDETMRYALSTTLSEAIPIYY